MKYNPSEKAQSAGKGVPAGRSGAEKPVLELRTENNNLTAVLRVKSIGSEQTLAYEDVMDFLKQKRISYGIREQAVKEYCERKRYFAELVCAQGLPPVDGTDGTLEFLFKTKIDAVPEQRDDGTVDYRALGLVQNIRKGEPLCRITPPAPGSDGVDVFGRALHFKEGRFPRFPTGRNVAASEDGLTLVALIDGCIEYKSMELNVLDSYIVHGDVDGASGNVDTVGSVTVLGDVREGFSVKAGGSITVRGMVEGARLQAGVNINIAKGMNGMNKGRLICEGSVTAKFLENCIIDCKGDVYSDVLMNSIVNAKGSVILRGRNGMLLGGRCTAGRRIYANYIGNANNLRTEAILDSPALERLLRRRSLEAPEGEIRKELEELRNGRSLLQSQIDTLGNLLTIGRAHEKVKKLIEENKRKQKEIDAQMASLQDALSLVDEVPLVETPGDFNVSGIRIVYSGVRIKIGAVSLTLKQDYSSTKFYLGKDEIESGPLLPSDHIEY